MLKKLVNNPFRILGVYSNAKPAEIVSNCDDMEAYLSIGQSVSFDLDLNNLMPNVVRSADSVANAKKQINLSKDKLKYALFWFIKDSSATHAINHLKNSDYNSANIVFELEDTFSTKINKAVVAILQDDLGTAISYITEMIHDAEIRNNFVQAICSGIFTITEDELAHLYIDSLLEEVNASELLEIFEENGTSEEDDDYLREKVIDEPISRINTEIGKAKSVARDDAAANYRACKALMKNTKNDLAKVKNMLGASDMKYQMLADDLANTILQCGINYFNNTDDDDDIEKALTIQQYACDIAVGRMCRDRCNQNVTILRRKKEEQAISSDLSFIADELQSFRSKTYSIDNAKNFVNICIPHLNNIKNQLGSSNVLYLQISSAVANNALGMLVRVINNAQQNMVGATTSALNSLKSKIDAADSVMSLIGGLDMTSEERTHFNRNKSSLNSLKTQVDNSVSRRGLGYTGGGDTSGGCYIATMCYGDYDHPQVLVLRDFRDSVLLHHSWGQAFVRFYYRNSPNWVEHLKNKRLINKIIRNLLDKFIILYKHVKK